MVQSGCGAGWSQGQEQLEACGWELDRQACIGGGRWGTGLWGPFLEKGHRRVRSVDFIPAQGGEGSSCCQQRALWAGSSHRLLAGSFSHLGTLPRSLLMGWAALGLGSRGPTAPSSAAGWGAGSGAGGGGGVAEALDMHLATSTSAADGETVCSSSLGSR